MNKDYSKYFNVADKIV